MNTLDDLFARYPMRPTVEARIRRLNPNLQEGQRVRGAYRKPMSWRRAKRLWQRKGERHWPYRDFMAPGGKRKVLPLLEGWMPGDFLPGRRCAR